MNLNLEYHLSVHQEIFSCNSKTFYKHLANTLIFGAVKNMFKVRKITLLEATIFDYFKCVNDS